MNGTEKAVEQPVFGGRESAVSTSHLQNCISKRHRDWQRQVQVHRNELEWSIGYAVEEPPRPQLHGQAVLMTGIQGALLKSLKADKSNSSQFMIFFRHTWEPMMAEMKKAAEANSSPVIQALAIKHALEDFHDMGNGKFKKFAIPDERLNSTPTPEPYKYYYRLEITRLLRIVEAWAKLNNLASPFAP